MNDTATTSTPKKPTNGTAAIATPPAAAAITAAPSRYAVLPIADVEESEENIRKTYDEGAMADLTASVLAHGVIVAVIVMPGLGKKPWELVDGNRRYRASTRARRTEIPAVVYERRLSPKEIRRVQFLTMNGREDLNAIEDAEAMRAMIDNDGETALSLAKLRNKSESWVYNRLQLCTLPAPVKKAMLEGKLPASHALLIARIPSPKLQAEAAAALLEGERYGDDKGVVLSFRKAAALVHERYMLQLGEAPFDITDATLVAASGGCAACPKRSGNQPELFADVKSKDTCTDPGCFDAKRKADWDKKAAEGLRTGLRVLSDKESKALFHDNASSLKYGGAYVDPHSTESVPYEIAQGKKSWAQLLGKELPAKVLARDGKGGARQLVSKDAATERLKKLGLLKKPKAAASSSSKKASSSSSGGATSPKDWQAQRKKEAEKQAVKTAVVRIALGKIGKAAAAASANAVKVWRYVAGEVTRDVGQVRCAEACEHRGVKTPGSNSAEKTLLAWVGDSKRNADELRGLAVELLAGELDYRAEGRPMKDAAELLGVDLKACEAEAKKEQQAKAAAPAAKKPAAKKGRK